MKWVWQAQIFELHLPNIHKIWIFWRYTNDISIYHILLSLMFSIFKKCESLPVHPTLSKRVRLELTLWVSADLITNKSVRLTCLVCNMVYGHSINDITPKGLFTNRQLVNKYYISRVSLSQNHSGYRLRINKAPFTVTFPLFWPSFQRISGTNDTSFESPYTGHW